VRSYAEGVIVPNDTIAKLELVSKYENELFEIAVKAMY